MVGIFSDQHLRDQRFGRDAAFNDARRCRRLNDSALAGTAAVARAACEQHTKSNRNDVEPLGHILADLVESAAAAGTGLLVDIDDLLDPFQMRRQRAPVGRAGAIGALPPSRGFAGRGTVRNFVCGEA